MCSVLKQYKYLILLTISYLVLLNGIIIGQEDPYGRGYADQEFIDNADQYDDTEGVSTQPNKSNNENYKEEIIIEKVKKPKKISKDFKKNIKVNQKKVGFTFNQMSSYVKKEPAEKEALSFSTKKVKKRKKKKFIVPKKRSSKEKKSRLSFSELAKRAGKKSK
ncbi:hypothetical protein DID75_02280 [Candidatus Marinamargulisbacteria bacterium SCGC AG-410-N11]|nr:hypothetical protein DID75_02280 [Candidatus Marinamargulisbacteria bacterium SCGC AG-410-N11]